MGSVSEGFNGFLLVLGRVGSVGGNLDAPKNVEAGLAFEAIAAEKLPLNGTRGSCARASAGKRSKNNDRGMVASLYRNYSEQVTRLQPKTWADRGAWNKSWELYYPYCPG